MRNNMYRNSSGCYDPTAGEAMKNIIRDEKRERKRRALLIKVNQPKEAKEKVTFAKQEEKTEEQTDEDIGI